MFIAPSTLAYAQARHHDLEREADRARLLRAARAALRACRDDGDDATCCPPGCCEARGRRAPAADAGASPRSARGALCRPAVPRGAGGLAALLVRAVVGAVGRARTSCPRPCAAA